MEVWVERLSCSSSGKLLFKFESYARGSSDSCRWQPVRGNIYKYSLDYEANGVGGSLFEDVRLAIDGDPRTITFLI